MSEDRWTDADDAQFAMHALPDDHPIALTMGVMTALDNPAEHQELLRTWVTPESVEDWGNFSEAATFLRSHTLGVLGTVRQYEGASDVAYVIAISQEPDAPMRMTQEDEPLHPAAVFTWIWRPDEGNWRLHSVGEGWSRPERLPRTSPDDAPYIDAQAFPSGSNVDGR